MVESFATVLGEVSELSAAVSQMRDMLLQITDDAINQDLQVAGSAADGAGSDGRSKREEISLAAKYLHKAWKQRVTKKHVRECLNFAMVDISIAELQSALRETVYIYEWGSLSVEFPTCVMNGLRAE